MRDVKLRDDVCDRVGLPIKLVMGRLEKLYVKVPWNQLSSSPVRLEVSRMELVISPLEKPKWEELIQRQ